MASVLIKRRLGDLPAEVNGFVGRQAELARLGALLADARLVTVTGPGGVGKTRVALRAAASEAGRFADGVCLAELGGLHDPELLPHTVANCLGLPDEEPRSQLDAVLDYLRDRTLLLILDTCEHLIDACASLADILIRETSRLTVLATSRQPLDVTGEHTCPIPPLPVPPPGSAQAGPTTRWSCSLSVPAKSSPASPSPTPTGPMSSGCASGWTAYRSRSSWRRCGCARCRWSSYRRLESVFRLLTGERRAALPHHQTLRTATQWSHELCSAAEQLLWARLSVFAGSFDVPAAEQVCAGGPLHTDDILPTLIGLVDKSAVLHLAAEGDGCRYRQLDTIREFGAEKLAEMGAESAVRERHVNRYLAMAGELGANPTGELQLPCYLELRREHDNIRAALEYAFALPGRDLAAAQIAADLYVYWQISGLLGEGRYWLGKALERVRAPSRLRAWALVMTAILADLQGDAADALAALDEGIPMAEELGEPVISGRGYSFRALAYALVGQLDAADAAGAVSCERLVSAGDTGGLLGLDVIMALVHLLAGRPDQGIARCAEGLARLPPAAGSGGCRAGCTPTRAWPCSPWATSTPARPRPARESR